MYVSDELKDKKLMKQTLQRLTLFAVIPGALGLFGARSLCAGTVYVGNSLTPTPGVRYYADGIPPLVILGEFNPSKPSAASATPLPPGLLQAVEFYGTNYDFYLYVLSYVGGVAGQPNEQQFQVEHMEHFASSAVGTTAVAQRLNVTPEWSLSGNQLLAFAGYGPWYAQQPDDAIDHDAVYEDSTQSGSFLATPPGTSGEPLLFTVGLFEDANSTYDYINNSPFSNQGRTYLIGVDILLPAANSCISFPCSDLTVTNCGTNLVFVSYPASITNTATNSCCGGPLSFSFTPESGSPFSPGGPYPVQVIAWDSCGNDATCSFNVTVVTNCGTTNCCAGCEPPYRVLSTTQVYPGTNWLADWLCPGTNMTPNQLFPGGGENYNGVIITLDGNVVDYAIPPSQANPNG